MTLWGPPRLAASLTDPLAGDLPLAIRSDGCGAGAVPASLKVAPIGRATRSSRRWIGHLALAVALGTVSGELPGAGAQALEPPGLQRALDRSSRSARKREPRPLRLPATGDEPTARAAEVRQPEQRPDWPTVVVSMPAPAVPSTGTPSAGTPSTGAVTPAVPPAPSITRPRPRELWERSARLDAQRPLEASHPITAAARSSQLAESAVDLLRQAHWSARRGAIHSARDAAWETLRTLAALRDTHVQDNRHAAWLHQAADAIAESADFTGRFGPVDPAAMARLIEVHQTEVLRHVDTHSLTPARAVEEYLDWAQERLVAAVGGGPLATEATIILADLESSSDGLLLGTEASPRQVSLHTAELALMYRRAAFQINPHHPGAAGGLGRILLARSLPEMAKPYLRRSVAARATRQNVQSLLRAAELTGDNAIASQCREQLNRPDLPSELPVQRLSPVQFAAMHQRSGGPAADSMEADGQPSGQVAERVVEPRQPSAPGRRGWFW